MTAKVWLRTESIDGRSQQEAATTIGKFEVSTKAMPESGPASKRSQPASRPASKAACQPATQPAESPPQPAVVGEEQQQVDTAHAAELAGCYSSQYQ